MLKQDIEKVIKYGLENGAEFVDLFFEKTMHYNMYLVSSKIERCSTNFIDGVGIRVYQNESSFYSWTNDLSLENLISIVDQLLIVKNVVEVEFELNELVEGNILTDKLVKLSDIGNDKIKEKLFDMNTEARRLDERIDQVELSIRYIEQDVVIASSKGNYVAEKRIITNAYASLYITDGEKRENGCARSGIRGGFEIFDDERFIGMLDRAYEEATTLLDAIFISGGKMPAVIANGFGSVIFHEACGHGLEASSVARNLSVFSGKLDEKIASEKVTLIDDGTIPGLYGSAYFDDDGEKTRRNILIENGVLKGYLVDTIGGKLMNKNNTGSSRRQNYFYLTTSRMTNTYLEVGDDKIEDMIESIEYGIYAIDFNGGSVNPSTGDFNFGVSYARLIENGKLTKAIKGASLIGNGRDILMAVEMVSDDLEFEIGHCGSSSGSIPTTCGQPTIKVSEILVGGRE